MDRTVLPNEKNWDYPAYALDPKLQEGKKLPKWNPKSRREQYVGKSPPHASSVGLIYNLNTRYISPRFYMVCDKKSKQSWEDTTQMTH